MEPKTCDEYVLAELSNDASKAIAKRIRKAVGL